MPAFPKVVPAQGANLDWTRQLMFIKDADQAGPAWILLRDTVAGGQPTAWQFWTLSEKLGTPAQVKDANAFLADKPGRTNTPVRELPAGDRYTALGQFDVDIEYFIASPADTLRHTLRYGGMWMGNRIPEYQDLLHLQLPGDGAYFVAVFPRSRAEPAPEFAALFSGSVVKAAGGFGSDYAFLSLADAEAEADGVTFQGTAGCAQRRSAGVRLALLAPGSVSCDGFGIESETPAALDDAAGRLVVSLPRGHQACAIDLSASGEWVLDDKKADIGLARDGKALRLSVPAGVDRVALLRK